MDVATGQTFGPLVSRVKISIRWSRFPWVSFPLAAFPGDSPQGGPRARSAAASCSMHDAASSSSRRDESGWAPDSSGSR